MVKTLQNVTEKEFKSLKKKLPEILEKALTHKENSGDQRDLAAWANDARRFTLAFNPNSKRVALYDKEAKEILYEKSDAKEGEGWKYLEKRLNSKLNLAMNYLEKELKHYRSIKEVNKSYKVQNSLILASGGLLLALYFLSPNITGYSILGFQHSSSNILGGIFLAIGLIGLILSIIRH